MSISELFKATQLTKGGRLMEATRMIQQALGLGKTAAAGKPSSQATGAAPTAARSSTGGQAVTDVPFRETLRRPPANESTFKAPVQGRDLPQPPPAPAPELREKADPSAPVKAPDRFEAPPVPEVDAPAAQPGAMPKPRKASFNALSFRSGNTSHLYRLYVPGSEGAGASANAGESTLLPLLVLLHGCKQDAADFARGTGMNELAETQKCLVLYPEQSAKANNMRCWNWFDAAHQSRDSGEPKVIAALIRQVIKTHGADPSRVYIAGLSAGGAMAAIMAGLYPDMFAAVGVHSGLPPGAAKDVVSAFAAMRSGAKKSAAAGASANDENDHGFVMPTIVFHGSADKTVNPDNGDQITEAALAALDVAGIRVKRAEQSEDSPGTSNGRRDTTRTIYSTADGKPYVEHWAIGSGPHAWSGGDAAGSFTDPHGPSASQAMVDFFLQHRRA
jgi:poly(hydroxyalkanoate) depolymerase family esterase